MNERLREFLISRGDDLSGANTGVAAARPGEPVRSAWLGTSGSNPPGDEAAEATDEPSFLVYSVTKIFIATLVLMLAEDGELSLDDRLSFWFADVEGAEEISLRQLLSHTAGLRDYGSSAAYHAAVREQPTRAWSFGRFCEETVDKGPLFAPGAGWAYSNPGFMLLRRIIEEVASVPFGLLVEERICKPLGLERTRVVREVADLAGLAPAQSKLVTTGNEAVDVRNAYHPGWVSHGLIASPPSELVRFIAGLFGEQLLERSSLDAMTELVPVPSAVAGRSGTAERDRYAWVEPGYGLGLMGDPGARWGPIYGHNGGGPGYSASAFHAPRHGLSVVVLAGSEGPLAGNLLFDLLDELVDR